MADKGEQVLVTNGLYRVSTTIRLTNAVTLRSVNGMDVTTLDGQNNVRCLYLAHSNALVKGFRITRGSSNQGSGVFVDRYGVVDSCLIANNYSWYGSWRDGGGGLPE